MESQWALANFTVPPECACVCAFGANSTVYGKIYDEISINNVGVEESYLFARL